MKKCEKNSRHFLSNELFSENDALFDPEENLYNNPNDEKNLTFTNVKVRKDKMKKSQNSKKTGE